jgi:carotenoid cleavage dioxygenase-like enzyme
MNINRLTRRQFGEALIVAAACGLLERQTIAGARAADNRSLNYLANRTAGAEGVWELKQIEGKVPRELNGVLIRTAPGQKDIFGTKLKHLFDGDAYLSKFSFRAGKVALQARFLDTPHRLEEQAAKRMLYSEAGTLAPPLPEGYKRKHARGKNQPSVNIVRWDGRLLGLSEGWHPVAIEEKTLSYQGDWHFYDTLPLDVTFTAHPKFDPQTGEGYAYGSKQGMGMALTVYRMEKDGKLKQLYALPQRNYFMVHDMLLAREHIVFVIPPVFFDLPQLFSGKVAPFEAARYAAEQPTRFVILRKDGTGKPVVIEQPANMVFHHGNAYEKDGKLMVDSLLSPDGSVMNAVANWDAPVQAKLAPNHLTRLVFDLAKGALESRNELEAEVEFPRFDERRGGTEARYLFTGGYGGEREGEFNALVKHDLQRRAAQRVAAGKGRAMAEPVFVPQPGQNSEERGWLLALGYDGAKDQTFLEIRDAGTLEFVARVWTGIHFPLGFHGNFYAGS